jgi:hypothetical protein
MPDDVPPARRLRTPRGPGTPDLTLRAQARRFRLRPGAPGIWAEAALRLCPTVMPSDPTAAPAEYRRYRRFLSWFVLSFVSIGSLYLLVSVGVTIYRRRHAEPWGAPVTGSSEDLESCAEELIDVEEGLERHLDNFDHLIAHYDTELAQRWSEERGFWLGQWRAAGTRCRYGDSHRGPLAKQWEQLAVIHGELRDTEQTYDTELLRFGQHEGPRLDQLRDRLASVSRQIGATSGPGSSPAAAPHDPGETTP